MNRSFQILSLLLSYPTEDIQEAAKDFMEIVATEDRIPEPQQRALARLAHEIVEGDLFDLQERYVLLFDRTRSLSLHLFEHVHGESRDRGQAMVDLQTLYENHGLEISARELPDYLPLFMEFLAVLPDQQAREQLGEPLHIISALKERLRKRKSAYMAVFWALEGLAAGKPKADIVEALLAEPDDDPQDLEALDKLWEEEAVTFGPGPDAGAGCGPDRLASRIRASMRPAPEVNLD